MENLYPKRMGTLRSSFKVLSCAAAFSVVAMFAPPCFADQPTTDVSFQVFYDQLSSQGKWIQVDNYGYCFQPTVADANWAPYRDGHWAYSDQGWTWVSNESFGWATYHYGRWANIEGTGWVWVPGNEWAPAWVSWRDGGGYAGWAPLPPESFSSGEYEGDGSFTLSVGTDIGSNCDTTFQIGSGDYNFVPQQCIGDSDYQADYTQGDQNATIINQTTNVTNITINRGATGFAGVRSGGPSYAEMNRTSKTPVTHVTLASESRPGVGRVNGTSLAVYAPHFTPNSQKEAKPTTVSQTINHATINHGSTSSATNKPSDTENKQVINQEPKPDNQSVSDEQKKIDADKQLTQQQDEQKKVEENKALAQQEEQKKADENKLANQQEEQKKADENKLANQQEEQKKADENKLANQQEEQKKADENKVANQQEEEKKAEANRQAAQQEEQKQAEVNRQAAQQEEQHKVEQNHQAAQQEEQHKVEQIHQAPQQVEKPVPQTAPKPQAPAPAQQKKEAPKPL